MNILNFERPIDCGGRMNILNFERPIDKVPEVLSHMSIIINKPTYSVKEEHGLEENTRHFGNKEELIKYLKEVLWN